MLHQTSGVLGRKRISVPVSPGRTSEEPLTDEGALAFP